jgi:hypothetical protein
MHAERRSWPRTSRANEHSCLRPRVVILDEGDETRVEVLELPEATSLGADFSHRGKSWRVTGLRSNSRVLIAEPVEN